MAHHASRSARGPSYDLVIHHNDPVCSPGWWVHVENFDGGAGNISGGIAALLINVLGLGDLVEYEVNDFERVLDRDQLATQISMLHQPIGIDEVAVGVVG